MIKASIVVFALLSIVSSNILASETRDHEIKGSWVSWQEEIEGDKNGFLLHRPVLGNNGTKLSFVELRCNNELPFIPVMFKVEQNAFKNTDSYEIALSLDSHEVRGTQAVEFEDSSYVIQNINPIALLVGLMISDELLLSGPKHGAESQERFDINLSGFAASLENACGWHSSYDEIYSTYLDYSDSKGYRLIAKHFSNVVARSSNGSKGRWNWGESDRAALAYTTNRNDDTSFGHVCTDKSGFHCAYVFQPEFPCTNGEEYSVIASFATQEEARQALRNQNINDMRRLQNSATGECIVSDSRSYIIFEEDEVDENTPVSDMLYSRLHEKSNVGIHATGVDYENHSSNFSLIGSSKALKYVSHKQVKFTMSWIMKMAEKQEK